MQFDKEVWESRACEASLRCDSLSNLNNKGELLCIQYGSECLTQAQQWKYQ